LAEGETLWDVARAYDVPLPALLERNALDDDDVRALRTGSAVQVPGITQADVERHLRAAPTRQARVRGFRHRVGAGDTIWSLAGAIGVSVAE
jgi:LysM repeat protein